MPTLPSLRVGLTLDSATFIRETNKVIDAVNRMGRDMQRQNAVTARSFEGINTGISSVSRNLAGLRQLIGIGSFAALGRQVIEVADSMTLLSARIRLFTTSAEEAAGVQNRLVQISTQTRVSLKDTGDLYSRLALTLTDAGVSAQQLLAVTDLVNKSLAVLGGSTPSTSAGMIQFSQAMGSGVLRGQELASVMEQIPSLAKNIADGLGVSIAELRKMGKEGELTTDRVLNALLKQAPKINEQFKTLPVTVGQSITQLGTAFSVLVGESNEATSATATLATAISDFAELISSPAFVQSFKTFASELIANTKIEIELLGEAAGWAKERLQDMGLASRSLPDVEQKIRDTQNEIDMLTRNAQEQGQDPGDNWAIASRRRRLHALLEEEKALRAQGEAAKFAGGELGKLAEIADQFSEKRAIPEIDIYGGTQEESEDAKKQRRFRENQIVQENQRLADIAQDFTKRSNQQRYDANIKATMFQFDQMEDITEKFHGRFMRIQTDKQDELGEAMKGIWQGVGQSIQKTFADTYEDIFTGGLTSFEDFAGSIKDVFVRLAAEIAATMTADAMFGGLEGMDFSDLFDFDGGAAGTAMGPTGGLTVAGQQRGFFSPGGTFIPSLQGGAGIGPSGQTAGFTTTGGQFIPTFGPAPGAGGFMGTGATGGQLAGAGAVGAFGGMAMGQTMYAGHTGATVGGTIGGGAGAAAGMALTGGSPIGAALGGLAGGALGSFIGRQFGAGKGQDNKVMLQGMLGAGAGGSGAAAQLVQGIDAQVRGLLTAAQEVTADLYLKRAAAVAVQYDKEMSAGDMARLTAGRLGPVAASLGFNVAAVTRGSAEQQQAQFQEAITAKQAIDDLRGSLTPFATQTENLREQMDEAWNTAAKYDIALDGVVEAQASAYAALERQQRAQYITAAQAVGASDDMGAALGQLQIQMEQAAADADALGISTANLGARHAQLAAELERQQRSQFVTVAQSVGAMTPLNAALELLNLQMQQNAASAIAMGVPLDNIAATHNAAAQALVEQHRAQDQQRQVAVQQQAVQQQTAEELRREILQRRLENNAIRETVGALTPMQRQLSDLNLNMADAQQEARSLGISTANFAKQLSYLQTQIINRNRMEENAIRESVGAFTPLQRAMHDLNVEMQQAWRDANLLGISTKNLGKIYYEAAAEIQRANRLQIHAAGEAAGVFTPLERALADLQVEMEQAYADATRLGLSTANLNRIHGHRIDLLIRENQAQTDALALSITNPFEELLEPLRQLGIELNTSLMDPLEQFSASAQNFRDIARAAAGGSTTAIAQLDEAARGFISTAETVGASPGRARAVQEVQAVLGPIQNQITSAQAQASRGVEGAIWGANQRVVDTLGELVTVGRQQIEEMRRLQRQLS